MRKFHYVDKSMPVMEDRDEIEEIIKENCERLITQLNLDTALEHVPQIEF